MTAAGWLLVICTTLPASAALLAIGFRPESQISRYLSLAFASLGLVVALITASLAMKSNDGSIHARVSMEPWKVSPTARAPIIVLDLPRSWSFAPSVAAAVGLTLLAKRSSRKNSTILLQIASVQGSLCAATPELGLAMDTLSTIASAISLAQEPNDAAHNGISIGFRWAVADAVLWLWVLGFLGQGEIGSRCALIALAVRAAVFPFQGAIQSGVTGVGVGEMCLALFPPIIWGLHWIGPMELPNAQTASGLFLVAAVVPALLGLGAKNDESTTAYFVASISIWPIAFRHHPELAIGLTALGLASSLCMNKGFATIAATGAVILPSLSMMSNSGPPPVSAAKFCSWAAVSISAAILHARPLSKENADLSSDVSWSEAILLTTGICSFAAPLILHPSALIDS